MATNLLIRADANTAIGSGHVMRCLALAQAWQERGESVTFVCSDDLPEALQTKLLSESMNVELLNVVWGSRQDADCFIEIAGRLNATTVVVDGYHFGSDYQRWLKDAGLRLLFIDDNGHADHYYADWVLNQNIHADESLYRNRETYTKLLLGTSYALLRREFWAWRNWKREIPEVAQNILITMGGADPDNVTLRVLESIITTPHAERLNIRVVVGGSNPHLDTLLSFVESSDVSIEILHNVSNMPELMAWADIAISAGGSTVWELCMMGLPSLLIVTADNQRLIVQKLSNRFVCVDLGWCTDTTTQLRVLFLHLYSKSERQSLSKKAHKLVDGFGAKRVANTIIREKVI